MKNRIREKVRQLERNLQPWPYGMEPTLAKVYISGNVVEMYRYKRPVYVRSFGKGWHGGRKRSDEPESERKEENRRLTLNRARNRIRRLTLANFDPADSKFITLTFAERAEVTTKQGKTYRFKHYNPNLNLYSPKECNKAFDKFLKRLRYVYGKFDYIAVIEFHKSGKVHYHMIAKLPYIDHRELTERFWGMGFTLITDITHVDNVGAYISAYLMEDLDDFRLEGVKAYNCSKGLKKPEVINGHQAEYQAARWAKEKEAAKVYEKTYPADFVEEISYAEYNILREDAQPKIKSRELVDEMKKKLDSLYNF